MIIIIIKIIIAINDTIFKIFIQYNLSDSATSRSLVNARVKVIIIIHVISYFDILPIHVCQQNRSLTITIKRATGGTRLPLHVGQKWPTRLHGYKSVFQIRPKKRRVPSRKHLHPSFFLCGTFLSDLFQNNVFLSTIKGFANSTCIMSFSVPQFCNQFYDDLFFQCSFYVITPKLSVLL